MDRPPLIELNARGLFPAPNASEEDFLRKVDVITLLPEPLISDLDLNMNWIPLLPHHQGLRFWEGGALWEEPFSPTPESTIYLPRIQIRTTLSSRQKEEILRHEKVHAARIDFHEPQFEELLAYATSSSRWRRYWGPFFRKPGEVLFFLSALLMTSLTPWIGFYYSQLTDFLWFPWIPLTLFIAGWFRLHWTHRLFQRCRKNLASLLSNPNKDLACMIRLSDAEIRYFATVSPEKIRAFIQQPHSFRWKFLASIYF